MKPADLQRVGAPPSVPHGDADGWVGTRELPGYRAGRIVVRLAELPVVDGQHLYFDLLLLDESGRTADSHSGPCPALPRSAPLDRRSAYVRIVAELFRHAPDEALGLAPLGPALALVRQYGIEPPLLAQAAQLLDRACRDEALVLQLVDMLELSVGREEAGEILAAAIGRLQRTALLDGVDPAAGDAGQGLEAQVGCIVRGLGRARARAFLREVTDFELLPRPEMFGL